MRDVFKALSIIETDSWFFKFWSGFQVAIGWPLRKALYLSRVPTQRHDRWPRWKHYWVAFTRDKEKRIVFWGGKPKEKAQKQNRDRVIRRESRKRSSLVNFCENFPGAACHSSDKLYSFAWWIVCRQFIVRKREMGRETLKRSGVRRGFRVIARR